MNIAGDEHSGNQTSDKADQVRRRSPDPHPNNFHKLNGNFLVQRYISGKIFVNIRSFFSRDISQHMEKMPYLAMLKNASKHSWIRIRKRMTSKM